LLRNRLGVVFEMGYCMSCYLALPWVFIFLVAVIKVVFLPKTGVLLYCSIGMAYEVANFDWVM
jgi:hypothetical protein